MLKWESPRTFRCPKNLFPDLLYQPWCFLCGMPIPPWTSFRSYLYFTFGLSSLPCLLCSMSCWPKRPCSRHSHVSLSFLFLQSSAMAICISARLWFPNTGILHLVYLIFLGCKLLYSSETLLAVLSKNPFLTLQPHEIPLFCLLTCFFCTIFCKFICHNVSFMLLSLLGNVTKHPISVCSSLKVCGTTHRSKTVEQPRAGQG